MGKGSLLERLGLVRSPPLTLEAFRERVIAEILRRKPDAEVERVGEADLKITEGGDGTVARAYQYYREHPRELDLVTTQITDAILHEAEPAKPEDLILLVRPDGFRTGKDGRGDCGPARPLAAGLVGIVAVDTPSTYRISPNGELAEELGMDDAAIWKRAIANLRERIGGAPPKPKPGYLIGMKTDVGLASSLLLLDEYWAHPHLADLGELVVAPIERDELVAVPAGDSQMVKALRNLVAQRDSSQFLCDRLLLRRNGAWEEFE
jgi:hypothetical protein